MPEMNEQNLRLPGGFNMPPFGLHQYLALIIVAVSLWAIGIVWLGLQGATQWVGSWQQQVELHLYISRDQQVDHDALQQELAAITGITAVKRISEEETEQWMRNWLGDAQLDIKTLATTLPVTYSLMLGDERGQFSLADLRDVAARYHAQLNEDELRLISVHDMLGRVQTLAWFATLVLAVAMALIVSNTLRMILLARIDEVHLMRLLGAPEWFVRMPFVLEGLALGAGAGAFAWFMLWPLVLGLQSWLSASDVNLNNWSLLLPLLLGGALVGGLGAVVATMQLEQKPIEC